MHSPHKKYYLFIWTVCLAIVKFIDQWAKTVSYIYLLRKCSVVLKENFLLNYHNFSECIWSSVTRCLNKSSQNFQIVGPIEAAEVFTEKVVKNSRKSLNLVTLIWSQRKSKTLTETFRGYFVKAIDFKKYQLNFQSAFMNFPPKVTGKFVC